MVFIIGVVTSIKLFLTQTLKYDMAGIILLSIALMQLVEYFIWIANETGDKKFNNMSSLLVGVAFILQIVATLVANNLVISKENEDLSLAVNTLGVVFFISVSLVLYKLWPTKNKIYSFPDKNSCRLSWGFNTHSIEKAPYASFFTSLTYHFILLIVISYMFGSAGMIIFLGTLFLSMIYAVFMAKSLVLSSYGSVWCFSVVLCFAVVSLFDSCHVVSDSPSEAPSSLPVSLS